MAFRVQKIVVGAGRSNFGNRNLGAQCLELEQAFHLQHRPTPQSTTLKWRFRMSLHASDIKPEVLVNHHIVLGNAIKILVMCLPILHTKLDMYHSAARLPPFDADTTRQRKTPKPPYHPSQTEWW